MSALIPPGWVPWWRGRRRVVLQVDGTPAGDALVKILRDAVRVRGDVRSVLVQKPSLGRIVLVPADPKTNNGADVAPAVITRVWSDTMVNLRVLLDGHDVSWRTSVTLFAGPDEFAQALAERDSAHPDLAGELLHGAYWPPRV